MYDKLHQSISDWFWISFENFQCYENFREIRFYTINFIVYPKKIDAKSRRRYLSPKKIH